MTPSFAARVQALRAQAPRAFGAIVAIAALLVLLNLILAVRVWRFRQDVTQLRASMTDAERSRADLALKSEDNRVKVAAEFVRRQARADRELHLTLEVDSNRMFLERDGVALREMPVALGQPGAGPANGDSSATAITRGARTVAALLGANDSWDVPERVYRDRSLPVPPDRHAKGALGRNAIVLDGGLVIYALPKDGPLADSSYVLPGAVMLRADDLRAIAPNVVRGMTVYVYD